MEVEERVMAQPSVIDTAGEKPQTPYERLRDSYPLGEDSDGSPRIGVLWRAADRERGALRDSVNAIMADESLSEEGKQQRIDAAMQRLGSRIEQQSLQAREKAQRFAKEYSERSVPMPGGRSLFTARVEDTSELLAIQHETEVIVAAADSGSLSDKIAERRGSRPKNIHRGGASDPKLENLRAYYADGLEAGGLQGRVQCHAVLRAAGQLGVDPEDVYGPLREENHRHNLQEAQAYRTAAESIPTTIPDVYGRPVPGGSHWRKGGGTRPLVTGGSKGFLPAKSQRRKPSWK